MIIKTKRASIFIYILLLVNISLIIGYVVFNNIFVLHNNVDIGNNSEEVFKSIQDKGNINIDTVRKYNGNGNGYLDAISCPTNITMSGTTSSGTSIVSNMVYDMGSIYCLGSYNLNDFRIYFDSYFNDFTKAYYMGDIVDIVKSIGTNIYLSTINITPTSSITSTVPNNPYLASNSADNNVSTFFQSKNKNTEYLKYTFSNDKSIGWITIKKESHSPWSQYWNTGKIYFYDSLGNLLEKKTISSARTSSQIDIDFKYRGLTKNVRSVMIEVNNKILDINEFEIYELESTGIEEIWEGNRVFNDSDNTLLSFTSDGIGGGDNIDDDFNSDNYKVTSIDDIYYSNSYQDDDVIPKLTFFGDLKKGTDFYNIFWNNNKTNDFIEKNINNNDILNAKIGNISNGYLYLDLFSDNMDSILYDLKIIEFDATAYKNEFTLLPLKSNIGTSLTGNVGYIENNSGTLSLSSVKTGNEFQFDFMNKDYALFLSNKGAGDLTYRLTGETSTGTMIYINPIDDSGISTISSLSNHIIIGGEKNFIGEDFVFIGNK